MRKHMQNDIQVFKHHEFGKFEIFMIDGKPYFPAVECAAVLGYSKPHNAISRHCHDSLKRGVIDSIGRGQNKLYIAEGDLYRLIIRSKLPAAVRFEKWVCDEVLPSIRKYGGYILSDMLEQLLADPAMAAKYFNMLKTEQDKSAALEAQIATLTPKARYYDYVLQCNEPMPVSVIAKDYGMTAIMFNKLLHSFSVQYKTRGTWLLYRKYSDHGYTISKTYNVKGKAAKIHTYWTQKGRKFVYDLLKSNGILPQAERGVIA